MTPGEQLKSKIADGSAIVGIIGMGYVGLPLAEAVTAKSFTVLGFDIDPHKVQELNAGRSYIKSVDTATVTKMRGAGLFSATDDFSRLAEADVIMICVPTPLTRYREPDMSFIENTSATIAKAIRPGQLIVLESTTYPGTTDEVVRPVLEAGGLRSGRDFFLAFSPEREDPGNAKYRTADIPKVVGGDGEEAQQLATMLYGKFVPQVVTVTSTRTAEAVKLTENIFRAVNIALVNELKLVYAKMGINIWEVIDAAKTKPFGFMPFYPGPGLGGHCIPIDPFYLTWKAREYKIATRFIELAGEVNSDAPVHVVETVTRALSDRKQKSVAGARILLMGVAYKKNVDDLRESPALTLIELLEERGASIDFYDPFVPEILETRQHPGLKGRRCIEWDPKGFGRYDCALICTDHDGVDYGALAQSVGLIIDTRNATKSVDPALKERVVLA